MQNTAAKNYNSRSHYYTKSITESNLRKPNPTISQPINTGHTMMSEEISIPLLWPKTFNMMMTMIMENRLTETDTFGIQGVENMKRA
jgi:hypothetical protein